MSIPTIMTHSCHNCLANHAELPLSLCKASNMSACVQVIEGVQNQDHGIVYCKLCKRHNRTNTFAYEGYR